MVTPVGRPVESEAIADFLASASAQPSAVVVEGEPGVGKTTIWLAAVDSADGFQVLSARSAAAESVLAYAALADMLGAVDADAWAGIPTPQRVALDRVLLRAGADEGVTDPRAVAAGFVSLVSHLEKSGPVLLAIDDLQWLDSSSLQVVSFAARRLSGRTGVLATVRTDADGGAPASWLQLPRLAEVRRIRLGPLTLGALRVVITERLARWVSRAAMVQIYEVSQGNPFYALELARVMDEKSARTDVRLPGSLAELVRTRIGSLSADVREVLLAASCVGAPTVDLVARAVGQAAERVVGLLVDAENNGIVGIDGHRINFSHPLLARGVYSEATAPQRREMHRNLAAIVEEPELQARHLAMAVAWGDSHTLECLDRAAEIEAMRGAPAAAAELLDLAVGLGGDSPQRRIRLATHHFNAGDTVAARAMIEATIKQLAPGPLRAEALASLAAVRLLDGTFVEAASLLERALDEAGDHLGPRVQLLVTLSFAQLNAGHLDAAVLTIEDAVMKAEQLGQPHLLSQALSMRVIVRFQRGRGLDEPNLRRALELEDRDADTPVTLRPSMQNVLLLAWTGRLEEAHEQILAIRRRCIEHGEESELMFVGVHSVLIDIWRGNLADAALVAEDAMERALQLGGDLPLSVALMIRAAVAAYAGREQEARRDASEALAASQRCRSNLLAEWPITIVGFLEVSLGNYQAALDTLQPMLTTLDPPPKGTEIFVASFVPDAVEAMIQRHRLADAEVLIDMLESNGRRLDRAWMLAVGARGRSLLQAAHGDLQEAGLTAHEAMRQHARVPMPFEKARTQLILGQLERRQRHREAATTALREALETFEHLGTPLWADRARAELARTDVLSARASELTVSEQRVAELAASGMTNRDVANALFISPKTVEANLVRIYRKLGIHSRAELGRVMGKADS